MRLSARQVSPPPDWLCRYSTWVHVPSVSQPQKSTSMMTTSRLFHDQLTLPFRTFFSLDADPVRGSDCQTVANCPRYLCLASQVCDHHHQRIVATIISIYLILAFQSIFHRHHRLGDQTFYHPAMLRKKWEADEKS